MDINNPETFAELTGDSVHDNPNVRRAVTIGTIVATTVVEDSIIKSIVAIGRKHVLPKAAVTVTTTGWSVGGGLTALALRSAITGVSGLAGAIIANALVHLTIDIVETVRSMPDADSSDDK